MKNKFLAMISVATLALSMSAWAQTTEETPAPSDQPSAPMEIGPSEPNYAGPNNGQMGYPQPGDSAAEPNDSNPNDAQPTEAQPGGPTGEAPAATDQGVGRISLIHGDVSTQRGDSGDWSAVTLNQPVMTGDKVSTGDDARTEVQLDFANTLRLGTHSKANIANLTKKNIQIQLAEGIADLSVSKDSEAEPEIDTPNLSIHPSHHDGVFRVEVRPDGDTIVIVRQGEAQIATPEGSTEVHEGDMATVRGTAEEAQYKISQAPDRDDWDRWVSDRDHMIQNANSWHHTNRRYTGTQDLDAYGNWQNVPDYGDVWVPNEPADWVPYRNGNWVYEPYYGWTWVGYEPWGWAPYHYGRWFPYGAGWAWWPGPVYAGYDPFWAPAYVSFFGWGAGFGFGFGWGGWGGFGWLPIGPCDWFHPWWGGYGGRFGYVGGFRGGWGGYGRYGGFAPLHGGNRFSNIANMHDFHVGRAMSTVNAAHFGAGRVSAMAATSAQLRGARMMAGNLPVVPSRASLSASGRAAAPSTMRNSGARSFYGSAAHNNMARPASFQQQTASLRQSMQASHVGAVPAGGRSSFSESNGFRGNSTASGSMGKPSAGSFQNGRSGNMAVGSQQSFNRGTSNSPQSFARGTNNGYRAFTPPNSNNRSSGSTFSGRTSNMGSANSNISRPNSGFSSVGSNNAAHGTSQYPAGNSGYRAFTPPSSSQASRGSSYGGFSAGTNSTTNRGSSGNYWNRTAPSSNSMGSRGYSGSYGGSSRPQLDMRQPIARSPSSGYSGYGGYSRGASPSYSRPSTPSYGGSYGGYRGSPSYGGYSRPSSPSYGGGYRGSPSYGGSRSAPSYGGGRGYSGGGGHYSAPSGGHSSGGGHSGGGGGHSSGGGHSGGGGHGGHR